MFYELMTGSMNHKGTVLLSTSRLILRQIIEEDAEEIYYGFRNQSAFLYYSNKEKITLEEEKRSLIGIAEKYKRKDYYNWVITLKNGGKIIGSINGYHADGIILINYAIDDRYKGNGFMTEALIKVNDFFINEIKIKKVECGCVIENFASKRVMEKSKMKYEGIIEGYVKLKDGYHDMHLFSLESGD